MSDDRRTARRARLTGIRVTYESATEHHQADVFDLSREGLFIAALRPLATGKRVSLEIAVAGEPTPWSALGRVIWAREQDEGQERPAGMAVKFIDIEDSVMAAIDRLIETRERTEPGLGISKPEAPVVLAPPAREKTMLGVGLRPVSVAPVVVPAPNREATILGVGREPSVDPREPSLAIDLVAKKAPSARPPAPAPEFERAPSFEPDPEFEPAPRFEAGPEFEPAPRFDPATEPAPAPPHASAPPPAPASVPPLEPQRGPALSPPLDEDDAPVSERLPRRRSGAGWLVLLLLLAGGGAAGYVYRARVLPLWHIAASEIARRLH